MAHIAYKFKLKPSKQKRLLLEQIGGACRFVWNHFLELNKQEYAMSKEYTGQGKFIFKQEMITSLPELKEQYKWLAEPPSPALQQRLLDLDTAIRRTFEIDFGFPHFKSKRHKSDTFRIPQTGEHIKFSKKSIKIPKIGWIDWRQHRPMTGKFKNLTIKQEGNNWFAICLCEIPDTDLITECHVDDVVGIDLGLDCFAVLSDGTRIENPKLLKKSQRKLRQAQRKLAKIDKQNNLEFFALPSNKRKGKKLKTSNRRNKQQQKVSDLHLKIRNQRLDFLHKQTTLIAKRWKVVGLESLNIKGLMRNRRLARAIADVGWGIFISLLTYKTRWAGGHIVKVDKFYPSSQLCRKCDHKQKMPLSQRTYICLSCGYIECRDFNASQNIKQETIRESNRHGICRIYGQGDTYGGGMAIDIPSYVSHTNKMPISGELSLEAPLL